MSLIQQHASIITRQSALYVFPLQNAYDVLSSQHCLFVFAVQSCFDIFAVGEEGVAEALGHEQVAAENAAEGRPFDLVDAVDHVVLRLILPHGQLELANCLFNLDLQHHVHRLWLGQPVIQFQNFIASQMANFIACVDGLGEVVHFVEHYLAPHQVANAAGCFGLALRTLLQDECDFLRPYLHDFVDDGHQRNLLAALPELIVDFGDDLAHPCIVDFLLEHLLQDTQDHFELLGGVLGQLHVDSIGDAIRSFTHCLHEFDEFRQRLLSLFVDLVDFAIQDLIVAKEGRVLEEIDFKVTRWVEVLHFDAEGIWFAGLRHAVAGLFDRNGFNHGHQFALDVENGATLVEGVIPEVLNKDLRDDVEVFFIVCEDVLHQGEDFVQITQRKLILVNMINNLNDFGTQCLRIIDSKRCLAGVELFEVGFE